jgi:hypothetical protein
MQVIANQKTVIVFHFGYFARQKTQFFRSLMMEIGIGKIQTVFISQQSFARIRQLFQQCR